MDARYKIGVRTLKTSLAVFFCLLFAFFTHRESAFYSSIAAVVCMQKSTDKTILAGFNRFIGTVIGGMTGFGVLEAARFIPHYYEYVYLFAVPLLNIFLIWLCNVIKKPGSVVICSIVFLSIVTDFSRDIPNTWVYTSSRIVDTTIGIIFAVIVNQFFFRPLNGGNPEAKKEGGEAAGEHHLLHQE